MRLGPQRALCALQRGRSVLLQHQSTATRTISSSARRQLEPTVGAGPKDDPQIGSYPRLEGRSNQERSATGFWDQQYRRNFGETLHEQDEALNMFSPDLPHANISPMSALTQASLAFAILGGVMVVLAYTRPEMPATRRTFPRDGLVDELGGWQPNKASLPNYISKHIDTIYQAKTESLDEH
ncbi:SubName: Full=Uncharacterized protein {ECO:0000313/EMBL:CCA74250.1} [Serendipita indica DSM 11827]|uniref:Uncharacterized protein n=1 Tax=Serendipita indica (strain DSM 11827) TaxID=1109443 RepID=G4TSF7_SERID|nr:SubName: Full=Uncharacterized protein {ECO:0000313/EMBL:CCA74250.1} [Serendipita indica DSM 11827]CCA74250.1 hypothetical protein PIIN_08203 [Serendipita indica DSM 11827]